MRRQITITCNGNNAIADSYSAGYQGEHNATMVMFDIPDDLVRTGYTYTAVIELSNGTAVNVDLDDFKLPLTKSLTAHSGILKIQLTVADNDRFINRLWFD